MSAETYLAARAAFIATEQQIQQAATTMLTVAEELKRRPGTFAFSNQAIGLPMEAALSRAGTTVDANTWPSVEKIMRLLELYHQQKTALRDAWSAVPENLRSGMIPPPNWTPERRLDVRPY